MRKSFNRNKKKRWRIVFYPLFFILVFCICGYTFAPKTFSNWQAAIFSPDKKVRKKIVLPAAIPKREIVPVFSKKKLEKDLLLKHQAAAKFHGVRFILDEEDLNVLIINNELVKVEDGEGFQIGNITHSYSYLVPKAKEALEKIGTSFYTFSGDSSTFTVTSLTRTAATQKKLRKRNSNATHEESTHCRGVSFDISYIRYNGKKDWNQERTKKLEGVLAAMQEKGEIYVIKERKQSCFHITVRN